MYVMIDGQYLHDTLEVGLGENNSLIANASIHVLLCPSDL